jgi:hypothetical protein
VDEQIECDVEQQFAAFGRADALGGIAGRPDGWRLAVTEVGPAPLLPAA